MRAQLTSAPATRRTPGATAALTLAAIVLLVAGSATRAGTISASGSGASALTPTAPCRLLDTREQIDGARPLGAGETIAVQVVGRCGVEPGSTAVAVTVTTTGTIGAGFVTAWASGIVRPLASSLNWARTGEVRANGALVPLGANGAIELYAHGSTHLVVDVTAFFAPADTATSGRFLPMPAGRLLDTREGGPGALAAGSVRRIALPPGVPSDATALSVNVTTTGSPGAGFFTAYAAGTPRPLASVLNTDGRGQTRAAGLIVPVTADGFDVYSHAGGHLIVDVNGWYTGPSAASTAEGLFVATNPTRVMDTRSDGRSQFWPGGSQGLDTTVTTGAVAAVATNVTMTQTGGPGYLTAFPAATAKPLISSLNADGPDQTVANLAIIRSSSGGVSLFSALATHLVVDIVGWFTGIPAPPSPSPHVLSNTPPPPPVRPDCSMYPTGRAAIADRIAQRVWLCANGAAVTGWMPFTAGPINDAPAGEYRVFFKRDPWWGGGYTLRHFTAFTYGDRGGRIAFHRYVSMAESMVGTPAYRNTSNGCFRMRAADAALVYSFLRYGDRVRILNNG